MKKYRKKYSQEKFLNKHNIIIFIVLFALGVWGTYNAKAPNLEIMMLDKKALEDKDITYISGYEVDGDLYHPINGDPQIDFANLNCRIAGIQVVLKEKVSVDTFIQVYYAVPGVGLQESNSVKANILAGTQQVSLLLPADLYREIRVDINGSFVLDKIYLSEEVSERQKSIEVMDLLLAFALSFVMTLVFPKKIREIIKKLQGFLKNIKNYKKHEIAILGMTIVGGVAWGIMFGISLLSLQPMGKIWYSIFFIETFIEIFFAIIYLKDKVSFHPEYVFLTIILLIGSYLAVSMPQGMVSWDDETHYQRALYVSHFISGKATKAECSYSLAIQDVSDKEAASKEKIALNVLYKQGIVENISGRHGLYNNICYIPAAFMMFLGRMLNMPAHSFYYMGRLGMLLVYAFLVFVAIQKLKSGKMILVTVALIPTNLFLVASYSYDPWVTGFSILGISYIIGELQLPEKEISKKDMIIILGAFLLMGSAKAIYFPMVVLALFIGKTKFKSQKEYRNFQLLAIGIMSFLILSFIVPMFLKPVLAGGTPTISDMRGGSEVNGNKQIIFILQHPIQYTKIVFNFLKDYLALNSSEGFVTYLGYLGHGIKFETFLLLLGIVAATDKNEYDSNVKYPIKWITFGAAIVSIILVATSMYIAFTSVASQQIAGCQPRYIMPIVFPILALAGSCKITNQINRQYYNIAIYGVLLYVVFKSFWKVCVMLYV